MSSAMALGLKEQYQTDKPEERKDA